jgi:hypothetical protein
MEAKDGPPSTSATHAPWVFRLTRVHLGARGPAGGVWVNLWRQVPELLYLLRLVYFLSLVLHWAERAERHHAKAGESLGLVRRRWFIGPDARSGNS